MKIDAKILEDFVAKTTLNGTIPSCIMRTTENGGTIYVRNGVAIACFGTLNKIAFKETSELELPIKSTDTLLKILKCFDGTILLKVDNNILKIYDEKREFDIVLAGKDYIDNEINTDMLSKFNYEKSTMISSEIFKRALTNNSILKEDSMQVKVEQNVLRVISGKSGFDKAEERLNIEYPNCSIELGPVSSDVFNVLDGDVQLEMKTNYPVKFVNTKKEMEITYFIAPIENVEEEKKESTGDIPSQLVMPEVQNDDDSSGEIQAE